MLQAILDRTAPPEASNPRIDRIVFCAGVLALTLAISATLLPPLVGQQVASDTAATLKADV